MTSMMATAIEPMRILKRLTKPQQWGFVFGVLLTLLGHASAQTGLRWELGERPDTASHNCQVFTSVTFHNDSDHAILLTLPKSQFPWWGWDGRVSPPPGGQQKTVPPHGQVTLTCSLRTDAVGQQLRTLEMRTDDPAQPQVKVVFDYFVRLAGILEFEQKRIDLGKVPVGVKTQAVFRFRNIGSGPCSITCKSNGVGPAPCPKGPILPGVTDSLVIDIVPRLGAANKTQALQVDCEPVTTLHYTYEGVERMFHEPKALPEVKE